MAASHVRARCKTTGHVAAISDAALAAGHFPDWARANGPIPKRPKPRRRSSRPNADSESAESEKE